MGYDPTSLGRPRGRRATRAAILGWRWLRYLGAPRSRRVAPLDLWIWVTTTYQQERGLLSRGLPWITFPAWRWLRSYLEKGMTVHEWGSGDSTIFFARRAGRVTSIEHEARWYEIVAGEVDRLGLHNVQIRHVAPEPAHHYDDRFDAEHRQRYASSDPTLSGMLLYEYARSIDGHPPRSVDVVMIDGRVRRACAEAARSRVRPRGIAVVDDTDRADGLGALEPFQRAGWTIRHFDGPSPLAVWPVFKRTSVCLNERP